MHEFKAFFNNKLFSNRLKKNRQLCSTKLDDEVQTGRKGGIHEEQRGRNNTTHGQTDLTDAYLSCKR